MQAAAAAELETFEQTPSARFTVGSFDTIGRRTEMQDTMLLRGRFRGRDNEDLYAVFDGHGARKSAVFVATHLPDILARHLERDESDPSACLRATFLELNSLMADHSAYGTTAVVALFKDSMLYVANVGDSRAVLCRNAAAVRLSVDHTTELEEERARVEALGGFIRNGRVQGVIQVTRALGDAAVQPFVSGEPHVAATELTNDDSFLILACDGLFDIFTDQVAVQIGRANPDPVVASKKLVDQAYISGSTDNISCLVVRIKPEEQHTFKRAAPPTTASALPKHLRQPKKPVISASAPTIAPLSATSDIVEV